MQHVCYEPWLYHDESINLSHNQSSSCGVISWVRLELCKSYLLSSLCAFTSFAIWSLHVLSVYDSQTS